MTEPVISVNGKYGEVVLHAADVEAVPDSSLGAAGGVATLDGTGKLPEGQLPSSVETSSPAPTGVAATDTANVQAALTAAAGGVCKLTQPGVYKINAALERPANCSIVLGPNTVLQASTAIAGPLLSDPQATQSVDQFITGGGTLDANNLAHNALFARYFAHLTLGLRCINGTQHTVIMGDTGAPATSYEAIFTPEWAIDRTSGSVPAGYYALWLANASDCAYHASIAKGQETIFRIDTGDNKFFGAHGYYVGTPHCIFDDNGTGNEYYGPVCDTMVPSTHAGATGEAASTTITDAAILPQHSGVPVSGTHIPAGSYVGTVTSGVSFMLVNNEGAAVNPTGAVSGITLAGLGFNVRKAGIRVFGGYSEMNGTYGVDNANYAMTFGPAATSGFVFGHQVAGYSGSVRFIQAITGNTTNITWVGLLQSNCVTVQPQSQIAAQSTQPTLRLVNGASGTAAWLVWVKQDGNFAGFVDNNGVIWAGVGGYGQPTKTVTEGHTLGVGESVIVSNGASLAHVLPSMSATGSMFSSEGGVDIASRVYTIVNIAATACTVTSADSHNVGPAATYTIQPAASAIFQPNFAGTQWDILAASVANAGGQTVLGSDSGTLTAGSLTTICTSETLQPGVYDIDATMICSGQTNAVDFTIAVRAGTGTVSPTNLAASTHAAASGAVGLAVSGRIKVTAAGTIILGVYPSGSVTGTPIAKASAPTGGYSGCTQLSWTPVPA